MTHPAPRAQRHNAIPHAAARGPQVAITYLHSGKVSQSFSMSLLQLMLHETGRVGMPPMVLANRCASGRLTEGRNELVRSMLASTACEWLLMVDDDMGFAPDTLERLLATANAGAAVGAVERPIVGGLCFGLRRESHADELGAERYRCFPTVYVWRETDTAVGFQIVTDYPRDAVVPVSATGAALVLIHRSVLERIEASHGPVWFDHITHPVGPTTFSEDMSFCIRAAAVDAAVFVDTSVRTSHDKGGVFLTEDTFDAQQALTALAVAELEHEQLDQLAAA